MTTAVVQAMTTGEAEKLLSAKGYLKSRNQTDVGVKVPGRMEQILVEEGSHVRKGDLLAVLEHTDIDAQIASGRAAIAAGQGRPPGGRGRPRREGPQAEADREARRAEHGLGRGDASRSSPPSTRPRPTSSASRPRSSSSSRRVKQTEVMLENMFIRAPFDGTVVKKDAEVGEMITGSGIIGRAKIVTLANLGRMDVETDVTESLLARLAIGQPAEISVSAVPTKRYRGRLRQIIPISDRARGTVKVMVEFLEPDEHLFPELVATVHFLPDKALKSPDAGKSYLFVPKSAIVEEGGHSFAYRVESGKSVKKVPVEMVVTNDDLARVESGLKAGDTVVLNPPQSLKDGEAVKVAE